jgi:hypothetical protein
MACTSPDGPTQACRYTNEYHCSRPLGHSDPPMLARCYSIAIPFCQRTIAACRDSNPRQPFPFRDAGQRILPIKKTNRCGATGTSRIIGTGFSSLTNYHSGSLRSA